MQHRSKQDAFRAASPTATLIGYACLLLWVMPQKVLAVPDVAVTASTVGVRFQTAVTSGSYAHEVPNVGANRLLIVAVGVTTTVSGSPAVSATWDPDTTNPGDDEALTCPAGSTINIGTNRGLTICTRLAPSVSSGNGRVTVNLTASQSFATSALTLTGIAEVRTATSSGNGFKFADSPAWTGCVATPNPTYTCTLTATNTQVDDVIFDLAGQGEPAPEGSRSFTPGAGQTKYDDQATLSTAPHLRMATSLRIAAGTSTSNSWVYGSAGSSNGVGHIMLPLRPSASVSAATLRTPNGTYFTGLGTRVAWTTEQEVSHIGFHLWRDTSGSRSRVTEQLLAGSIFMTGEFPLAGRRDYVVWDSKASPTTRYWLEEVATQGVPRWHGPIAAHAGHLPPGKAQRLREATVRIARDVRTNAARDLSVHAQGNVPRLRSDTSCTNEPAGRAAVKLGVSRTGWHRVEAEALFEAGLSRGVDPSSLALFVDGKPVSLRVVATPSLEAIEFYGESVDTRESDTRVYWLLSASGKGLRIADAAPSVGASSPTSFASTVSLRERALYFAPLLNGAADNFFGATIADRTAVQTVPLHFAQAGQPASFDVTLQGATTAPHRVEVKLNGTALGTVAFSGREAKHQRFDVDATLITAGNNELTFTRTGGAESITLVDRVRVTYERSYHVTDDRLEASAPPATNLSIGGFSTASARIFDITDSAHPIALATTVSAEGDTFVAHATTPAASGQRLILAVGPANDLKPAYVVPNLPSALCEQPGKELAILAPRSFFAALAPYVAARRQQGFGVELIDIEDVYDELSSGLHTADAITRFVGLRTRTPSPLLRYLLLVGDASVDPRDFLGKGVPDHVPTRLIDTPAMETASDDALVDADGDGLPDVAVGRWPARSAEDVQTFVARTLKLNGHRLFDRQALLVSGKSDGFDFSASARDLLTVLPQTSSYLNAGLTTAELAKTDLAERWSQGPSFIQFLGHGSQGVWQGLLSSDEVTTLASAEYPPVISAMTCLNGFFHDVFQDSLAERLLRSPTGAAAVWTSSTLEDSHAQRLLSLAFLKHAGSHALGEAIRLTRHETSDLAAGRAMVLLGDPTLFGTPTMDPSETPEVDPTKPDETFDGSMPKPVVDAGDMDIDESDREEEGEGRKPTSHTGPGPSTDSACSVGRVGGERERLLSLFMLLGLGAHLYRRRTTKRN